MEKIKLTPEALAFCQGMIFEDGELRPLPVPEASNAPIEIATEPAVLPEIEFGMQKAGTLAIADRFAVPERLAPSADSTGSGSSAIHPATEAETLDGLNASRAIAAAYERALAQQAEGKGLFANPFFVRYAWRCADGRHSRPSSPVLMLPAVLPPCLAVLGNEAKDGMRVLSFSPSSCRYYSLRCRVRTVGTPGPGVVALDIFITPPVSTRSQSEALPRGVTRWSAATAFVGHFSEGGDVYAEHTAESIGLGSTRAWHFPPNPNLESELLQSVDFYRIASLPAHTLAASSAFADVPVSVATDPASVKACQKLEPDASCASLLDNSLDVVRTATLRLGGRLLAAGSQMAMPDPMPLRTLVAVSGAASAESLADTEITVWAKRGAQIRHVTKAFRDGPSVNLLSEFPHHIHYPCPGAFRMRIVQGSRSWTLPLVATADGRGACWWGGLGQTAAPDSSLGAAALPSDNGSAGPFDCGCVVAVSPVGNDRVRESLCHCGSAAPVGIAAEPGQPGQAIVFTSQGAWQLTRSGGRYSGSRMATADDCLPGYSPCALPGAIAYATSRGLALLSGSSLRIIPAPEPVPTLPSLSLLNPAAPPQFVDAALDVDTEPGHAFAPSSTPSRSLRYDGRRLYASDSAGRRMAYSPASGAVGIPSDTALIVTRPFALAPGKRLTGISVSGLGSSISMALWGSPDGAAWTLVASSASPRIRPVCGTPYRWYAAAIISPVLPSSLRSLDISCQ